MSERKVLNKYYPPDFDPSKIPRLHLPKERQYTVRLMAPFNMRCKTCGEYIYKGKKFNARKETVQGEDYLGIKIFRFYIKCTRCLAEITFKTDPKNADYDVEHGATRNFQALKLAEEQAEREQKEKEDEEASNPMKLLENRTKASKFEMEMLENLEELRDLNQRHANVDYEKLLEHQADITQKIKLKQEEDDEAFIRSVFGRTNDNTAIKRLIDNDDSDDEDGSRGLFKKPALSFGTKPTDILVEAPRENSTDKTRKSDPKPGFSKSALASLVKVKKGGQNNSVTNSVEKETEKKTNSTEQVSVSSSALSILSAYSGSDSDSDE